MKKFPSPTGVNHYELSSVFKVKYSKVNIMFPSPTGVNHYELRQS